MTSISLPDTKGHLSRYTLTGVPIETPKGPHDFSRIAFSAAHVVADPFSAREPSIGPAIEWDATLAYRRHLLDLGLGIAEAMDTAQRGGGLDWPGALELITQSLQAAKPEERDRIFSGIGTDHLSPNDARSIDDVIRAYLEQVEAVQKRGGRMIMMASRALARIANSAKEYETVYAKVLDACDKPVILHWLGDMFDPQLKNYWGADTFETALETSLRVIEANAAKIDGIKISLLDDQKEILMRRRLPHGVKMYTGDDFNYPELIKGDAQGFSHALLGIFDAIAPAASAALAALKAGNNAAYDRIFAPTVPLSRLIFRSPTQYYKTGIVFLAYLNGFQPHFTMIGGAQSMRPLPYFTELFTLADKAGLLANPDDAAHRMKRFLALYGVAS
jgi:dihydrodipicolinate synthase/N-acetylneuraminate lyase